MQVLFMEVLFPFTIFAVLMVLLRGFSYSVNTSVGKSWLATLAREKYEQNVCIAACFQSFVYISCRTLALTGVKKVIFL